MRSAQICTSVRIIPVGVKLPSGFIAECQRTSAPDTSTQMIPCSDADQTLTKRCYLFFSLTDRLFKIMISAIHDDEPWCLH